MKNKETSQKKLVIVSIAIIIGILHLFTGPNYKGPYPKFVHGYLMDILVPFSFYFLLCLPGIIFRSWYVRGGLVFLTASLVETLQFHGVIIFGQTFDPLDFVSYGIGVLSAALIDFIYISRLD